MESVSFLHAADLHLSRPFGFLPLQIAEERRRDQRRTLTKISDIAIEHKVDLFLIAGDLFNGKDPDPTDIEAFTSEVARLSDAGIRIFVIPGNHDFVARNSFWTHIRPEGLHIFIDPEWHSVVIDDLGIVINGIAFSQGGSERRAFEGFESIPDMTNIVLVHASYEVFEGQLERYHPSSARDIESLAADYVALGHYHRFNIVSNEKTTACYPGSPEGISFDSAETGDRSVVLGKIEGGRITVEPIKVNQKAMKSVEIDCTSYDSETSILNAVRSVCDKNALIELRLSGTPNPEVRSTLDSLQNRFKESCFHFSIDKSGLSAPTDIPVNDRTIKGRFCASFLQRIEETADPEKKRVLKRALELGLAAFTKD